MKSHFEENRVILVSNRQDHLSPQHSRMTVGCNLRASPSRVVQLRAVFPALPCPSLCAIRRMTQALWKEVGIKAIQSSTPVQMPSVKGDTRKEGGG